MDAYEDRNLLAILAASLLADDGCNVGWGVDDNEPDWPVLYIDLPTGQISYHIPRELYERLPNRPEYSGAWDGHTDDEKRERLWQLFTDGELGPYKSC